MRGLARIYEQYADCKLCPLHETRRNMVFGSGPEDAPVVLVGMAPGEIEDKKGEPFVGPSGEFLDKVIFKKAGVSRDLFFITNTICCRAFLINEFDKEVNRDPTKSEIAACYPRLAEVIYNIDPVLVVALGSVAANALSHNKREKIAITKQHGLITPKHEVHIQGYTRVVRYALMPTFHPAYLLKNPDLGPRGWVNKTIEDVIRVKEVLLAKGALT